MLVHTLLVAGSACGKEATPPPADVPTGTIVGRIRFAGDPPAMPEINACGARAPATYVSVHGGALADTVVRLAVGDLPKTSGTPAEPIVIDQKGCRFQPHVLAIVSGQKLAYRNSDTVMHDVRTSIAGQVDFHDASRARTFELVHDVPVAPGDTPYEVRCAVHPWMEAHVLVGDQPIQAVTGADGAFTLAGVPAGRHTLEAWHPHLGTRTTTVTVEPGKPVEAAFAPYQARDYQAP